MGLSHRSQVVLVPIALFALIPKNFAGPDVGTAATALTVFAASRPMSPFERLQRWPADATAHARHDPSMATGSRFGAWTGAAGFVGR